MTEITRRGLRGSAILGAAAAALATDLAARLNAARQGAALSRDMRYQALEDFAKP
jgi:hypothetical protein